MVKVGVSPRAVNRGGILGQVASRKDWNLGLNRKPGRGLLTESRVTEQRGELGGGRVGMGGRCVRGLVEGGGSEE